jgi:hypothetical protein
MWDLELIAFSHRPASTIATGGNGVSRFSHMEFPDMPWLFDSGSPKHSFG